MKKYWLSRAGWKDDGAGRQDDDVDTRKHPLHPRTPGDPCGLRGGATNAFMIRDCEFHVKLPMATGRNTLRNSALPA